MLERDYIMRMTQQIAQFLAKMVFNRESRLYESSHELFDSALRQYFALSRELLLTLSTDDCLRLACGFSPPRAEIVLSLVDLMLADAEACSLEGRGDLAIILCDKAAIFLDRLQPVDDRELSMLIAVRRSVIATQLNEGRSSQS